MERASFKHHVLGIRDDLREINLLREALPADVAMHLVDAEDGQKLHLGMAPLLLTKSRRHVWMCGFGPISPDDVSGFSVQIIPERSGTLSVSDVRNMERKLLDPAPLSQHRRLTVMPYSEDAAVMHYMRCNLREDKPWWWHRPQ